MQKVVRFISLCVCSIGNIRSIKMTNHQVSQSVFVNEVDQRSHIHGAQF